MKLTELIDAYLPDDDEVRGVWKDLDKNRSSYSERKKTIMDITTLMGCCKGEAHCFVKENTLTEFELDDTLCGFLKKIKQGSELSSEEFTQFFTSCNELDNRIKDSVFFIVSNIINGIYKDHLEETITAVESIETARLNSSKIPQEAADAKKYIGLINAYHLFSQLVSSGYKPKTRFGDFPRLSEKSYDLLASAIPLAINSLTLTGRLPKDDYNGVNTAQPLYPLNIKAIKETKLLIKKGIKKSDDYFPYKSVSKIARGVTGDNTFLATNGSKFLFMRGVEDYAPHGILASKIATLVSATHFSSERLMDNKIVASKGIKTYARSFADKTTRDARKKYIQDKKIFPGTGIIDEVTNYVHETDRNVENLGFSSSQIDEAHLSKIDFDHCDTSLEISKNDYEQNLVSKEIYSDLNHVEKNKKYIDEKLYARLKLSMITEPLLRGLADKAYIEEPYVEDAKHLYEQKEAAIKACSSRSDIALELFAEHSKAEEYMKNYPKILSRCYSEISEYIKNHFEENAQQEILNSLKTRVDFIRLELSIKFKNTHYNYLINSPKKGRYHALQVSSNNDLKEPLSGLKGDYLKSRILIELQSEIENLSSADELDNYAKNLKTDSRFAVLATGQGITTRLFGLKTSSIKALNEMIEDQRAIIKENKNKP